MRGGGPHPSGQRDGGRWPFLPPPSRGVGGGGANCRPLPSTWYSGGRYTPPSHQERGDGFNHHSTQQDEPCGQPRAVSPRARQAFDMYQECVAAGLCARLVLEQKQGGERISFTCRPAAAATYAAVAGGQRRPAACGQHRLVAEEAGGHRRAHNPRRAARKRRWPSLKRAATDASAAAVAEAEVASAAECRRHSSLQLALSCLTSGIQLALHPRVHARSSTRE